MFDLLRYVPSIETKLVNDLSPKSQDILKRGWPSFIVCMNVVGLRSIQFIYLFKKPITIIVTDITNGLPVGRRPIFVKFSWPMHISFIKLGPLLHMKN